MINQIIKNNSSIQNIHKNPMQIKKIVQNYMGN
jgi:hypothetical protein